MEWANGTTDELVLKFPSNVSKFGQRKSTGKVSWLSALRMCGDRIARQLEMCRKELLRPETCSCAVGGLYLACEDVMEVQSRNYSPPALLFFF